MDEFIKLLDPAYELIQYRIKEDKVIFHIASTIAAVSYTHLTLPTILRV